MTNQKRMMISVDDQDVIRMQLEAMAQRLGLRHKGYTHGKQFALELPTYSSQDIALITLDGNFPWEPADVPQFNMHRAAIETRKKLPYVPLFGFSAPENDTEKYGKVLQRCDVEVFGKNERNALYSNLEKLVKGVDVLIVDDNEVRRIVLEQGFKSYHLTYHTVSSSRELDRMLKRGLRAVHYLVALGHKYPGVVAADRIHEVNSHSAIIMYSTSDDVRTISYLHHARPYHITTKKEGAVKKDVIEFIKYVNQSVSELKAAKNQ